MLVKVGYGSLDNLGEYWKEMLPCRDPEVWTPHENRIGWCCYSACDSAEYHAGTVAGSDRTCTDLASYECDLEYHHSWAVVWKCCQMAAIASRSEEIGSSGEGVVGETSTWDSGSFFAAVDVACRLDAVATVVGCFPLGAVEKAGREGYLGACWDFPASAMAADSWTYSCRATCGLASVRVAVAAGACERASGGAACAYCYEALVGS